MTSWDEASQLSGQACIMDLPRAVLGTTRSREQESGVLFPALQVMLAEFYKGAPDLVKFQEAWSPEHTYLDKLKVRCGPVGEHKVTS